MLSQLIRKRSHNSLLFFVLLAGTLLPGQAEAEKAEDKTVTTMELVRNKKLLEKTTKDLDAYRIMIKHIGNHKDDNNRLLLLEETGKFIETHVDPLLKKTMFTPETLDQVIALIFLKAYVKFEAGEYKEYEKIIKWLESEYGKHHHDVLISTYGDSFETIGEAIRRLAKKIP